MFKRPNFFHHPFFEGQNPFQPNYSSSDDIGRGAESGKRFFKRGDIKIVLMKLLQEQPRHGYELIKVLEERFKGFYSPSPGSVYPTLQMLEEQELVNIVKEGRKNVYHLTDEGQAYLDKNQNDDPFVSRMNMFEHADMNEMQTLRSDMHHLFNDFLMTGRDAMVNPEKMEQLKNLLKKTREELSKILKDDEKNINKE